VKRMDRRGRDAVAYRPPYHERGWPISRRFAALLVPLSRLARFEACHLAAEETPWTPVGASYPKLNGMAAQFAGQIRLNLAGQETTSICRASIFRANP